MTPLPWARLLAGPLEDRARCAVRDEMALTLADAVLRPTPGLPGIDHGGDLMAAIAQQPQGGLGVEHAELPLAQDGGATALPEHG